VSRFTVRKIHRDHPRFEAAQTRAGARKRGSESKGDPFEPVSVTIWVMNADTGAIVASNVVGVSPMRNALVSYSGTAPYFCRFEFLGSKRMLRGTLEQVVSGDVSTTLEAH
jgi:hypothetical protein